MKKAQSGANMKKPVVKVVKKKTTVVTPKKKVNTDNDVQMYKIKGKTLSGEGFDAMDQNYNMLKKNGGKVKKAANGTSLGMKSVKAGFDKNPGVTRADIITAAKGKAKSGSSIKKAQNGYQKNKGFEAIKEKELKTIAKTKKTAKTMKSGGKMTKCKYGCK